MEKSIWRVYNERNSTEEFHYINTIEINLLARFNFSKDGTVSFMVGWKLTNKTFLVDS